MKKLNCWAYNSCAIESHDSFFEEIDTCPSSTELCTNRVNDGTNGGRACWAIAGTFSGSESQCVCLGEMTSCRECDFYKIVQREEGDKLITGSELTEMVQYKEEILIKSRQL